LGKAMGTGVFIAIAQRKTMRLWVPLEVLVTCLVALQQSHSAGEVNKLLLTGWQRASFWLDASLMAVASDPDFANDIPLHSLSGGVEVSGIVGWAVPGNA
jgi:hypothetical protein